MDIATAHVLVTGGNSGIGMETARELRRRGARVAICGRDARRVEEAAAAINNAGFGHFAPLLETTLAGMQRVYATNVFGAMLVARESARHFVAQQRGNIVNVASTARAGCLGASKQDAKQDAFAPPAKTAGGPPVERRASARRRSPPTAG